MQLNLSLWNTLYNFLKNSIKFYLRNKFCIKEEEWSQKFRSSDWSFLSVKIRTFLDFYDRKIFSDFFRGKYFFFQIIGADCSWPLGDQNYLYDLGSGVLPLPRGKGKGKIPPKGENRPLRQPFPVMSYICLFWHVSGVWSKSCTNMIG